MWKPLTKEEYEKQILSKPKPVFVKRITYEEYIEKNQKKEKEIAKILNNKSNEKKII